MTGDDDLDRSGPGTVSGATTAWVSRRRMLAAAAGGAVAGGIGVAAGPPADADQAIASTAVGTGPRGTTTVEFRGRISQSGSSGAVFTSLGYLTRATHTKRSQLFAGAPHNESTALLTAFATGDLQARVLDQSVHSLDIVGTLAIHQRRHPGAHFDDPSSFRVGPVVARYDLILQDVLAVYAAGKGIPTLTGDMVQTVGRTLSGDLTGKTFGRTGSRLRFFATGLGTLTDPVTLNADLEIAGNWSIE
jgi:hypothetical protein